LVFSQTAEYTLRVVVFLATLGGRPATTRQIAATTRVPEGYLAKIIQTLSRAGLIIAQRGPGGGSVLAKGADEISMFDVIEAVAPLPRILTCPLGLPSHGTRLCPVHKKLDDAMATLSQTFKDATIADLLAQGAGGTEGSIPLVELSSEREAATRAAEAAFPVVGLTVRRGKKK
jgi:Rrf2 family nitric oxide-sensitive transcriptional repressor